MNSNELLYFSVKKANGEQPKTKNSNESSESEQENVNGQEKPTMDGARSDEALSHDSDPKSNSDSPKSTPVVSTPMIVPSKKIISNKEDDDAPNGKTTSNGHNTDSQATRKNGKYA